MQSSYFCVRLKSTENLAKRRKTDSFQKKEANAVQTTAKCETKGQSAEQKSSPLKKDSLFCFFNPLVYNFNINSGQLSNLLRRVAGMKHMENNFFLSEINALLNALFI